ASGGCVHLTSPRTAPVGTHRRSGIPNVFTAGTGVPAPDARSGRSGSHPVGPRLGRPRLVVHAALQRLDVCDDLTGALDLIVIDGAGAPIRGFPDLPFVHAEASGEVLVEDREEGLAGWLDGQFPVVVLVPWDAEHGAAAGGELTQAVTVDQVAVTD